MSSPYDVVLPSDSPQWAQKLQADFNRSFTGIANDIKAARAARARFFFPEKYDNLSATIAAANTAAADYETGVIVNPAGGDFNLPSTTITGRVAIIGSDNTASRINLTSTTGVALDLNGGGQGFHALNNITFRHTGSDATATAVKLRNMPSLVLDNVRLESTYATGVALENINFIQGASNFIESHQNTALSIAGGSNIIGGSLEGIFRTDGAAGAANVYGPTVKVAGPLSGFKLLGKLGGAGPRLRLTINVIASDASGFIAACTTPHGLVVGETFIIHGTSNANYNGYWKIGAVINTTDIKVVSTVVNFGASAGGVLTTDFAGLLITNEAGSVNECDWSSLIYEAINPLVTDKYLVGSWAVLVDASRNAGNTIYNQNFESRIFDLGFSNLRIIGNVDGSGYALAHTISAGGAFVTAERSIQLEGGVDNVTINAANVYGQSGIGGSRWSANAACVYAIAKAGRGPKGIIISGSQLGRGVSGNGFPRAIVFDGAGSGDVVINGSIVRGSTTPIDYVNGATALAVNPTISGVLN